MDRMTYAETAEVRRALGLTLAQADGARFYAMSGTDGRGFLLYDPWRFWTVAYDAATA
jgi:hypothetical protein